MFLTKSEYHFFFLLPLSSLSRKCQQDKSRIIVSSPFSGNKLIEDIWTVEITKIRCLCHFIICIIKNMAYVIHMNRWFILIPKNKMLSTMHWTSSFNISKRTNSSLTDSFMFLLSLFDLFKTKSPFGIFQSGIRCQWTGIHQNSNQWYFGAHWPYLKFLVHFTYYFKLVNNNSEP